MREALGCSRRVRFVFGHGKGIFLGFVRCERLVLRLLDVRVPVGEV